MACSFSFFPSLSLLVSFSSGPDARWASRVAIFLPFFLPLSNGRFAEIEMQRTVACGEKEQLAGRWHLEMQPDCSDSQGNKVQVCMRACM